jgi:N-acetylmuramoyl-L-alanine amidase
MKKALVVPLLWLFLLSHGEAFKGVSVEKVRYSSNRTYTRVVVDLTGPVEFTSGQLTDPDRLYFDLKGCLLFRRIPTIFINDNVLKAVRIAQHNRSVVRVVLDLKGFDKFYAFTLENPNRLVIDVYASRPHEEDKRRDEGPRFDRIDTVVIDPGHGGEDPGAIGASGLREKDVVLDVAKKLGRILKERYGVRVFYTRTKDVFIPLNERTEFANKKGADLFISIHANASRRRHAKGIETYVLNWTNDKEAIRVAARENAISPRRMQRVQDELQMILLDLARNNKRDESIRLAHSVQSSLTKMLRESYRGVEDLGVKQALFYVLIGAEMPSILAEISFISNPIEEKRLATERYRHKIAEAIAKGVGDYINQSTLVVRGPGGNI